LLIALLTVLFIGTLAFASNIKAFTLHSLPTFIVCLWLSDHDIWLRMTYSFALPVVAIAIHNILQRRNDRFAQELLSPAGRARNPYRSQHDGPAYRAL
jgi:hypothetical protein